MILNQKEKEALAAWLENIAPGDAVGYLVNEYAGTRAVLTKVARLTNTMIICENKARFYRAGQTRPGVEVGGFFNTLLPADHSRVLVARVNNAARELVYDTNQELDRFRHKVGNDPMVLAETLRSIATTAIEQIRTLRELIDAADRAAREPVSP